MISTSFKTIICLFLTGSALISARPALAEQPGFKNKNSLERSAPVYTLPGVTPAKPIVTPPDAEPENNTTATNPDGSFNIGNTKVKISGSVTVDIGTGNTHQSNR